MAAAGKLPVRALVWTGFGCILTLTLVAAWLFWPRSDLLGSPWIYRDEARALNDRMTEFYALLASGRTVEASARMLSTVPAAVDVTRAVGCLDRWCRQIDERAEKSAHECSERIHALAMALESYAAEQEDDSLPPSLQTLVPKTLKTLPDCPAGGQYRYVVAQDSHSFVLSCQGKAHQAAGVRDGSPEYSSRFGLIVLPAPRTSGSVRFIKARVGGVSVSWKRAVVRVEEQFKVNGVEHSRHVVWAFIKAGTSWRLAPETIPSPGARAEPASWAPDTLLTTGYGLTLLSLVQNSGMLLGREAGSEISQARCRRGQRMVRTALEAYSSDHDGRYPTSLKELLPRYLRSLPDCPLHRSSLAEGYRGDGYRYTLRCLEPNHNDDRPVARSRSVEPGQRQVALPHRGGT